MISKREYSDYVLDMLDASTKGVQFVKGERDGDEDGISKFLLDSHILCKRS
jgi:hypothetical protein